MPHISQIRRFIYRNLLEEIQKTTIDNKGELEYLIYNLLKRFMSTRDKKYSTLHEAVYGGIHACEEYKRLYLDKREDKAMAENGEA